MPQDSLRVHGMVFHAYHGLYDDERENGQRFEIDVELNFDIDKAAQSDQIQDTVDVRTIYQLVKSIVLKEKFYLIEALAKRIATVLLEQFNIEQVTVRVRKPFAPLGGLANGTEIEITRARTSPAA